LAHPLKELHPELIFEGITTRYFSDTQFAIHAIRKELPSLEMQENNSEADFVTQFVIIDRRANETLTDVLHSTLGKYYDQLPFIPTHILVRLFPFKIVRAKYNYTYFSAFSLATNNNDLLNYFSSIEIQEKNEIVLKDKALFKEGDEEKVFEILRKLNDNLVSSIYAIEGHGKAVIELQETRDCQCVRCSYNRLHFLSSLARLIPNEENDLRETLKHAYMQFQFGNFSNAMELFFAVYDEAKEKKKYLLAYICLNNLKTTKNHLTSFSSSYSPTITKLSDRLEKLSLREEILSAAHEPAFVLENIKWIAEKGYFNHARIAIIDVVEKIRSHYKLQLRGGSSRNSNVSLLFSAFSEIESYLDHNFILCDNFSPIRQLFDYVLEGLLMTYSFNENQSQRLLFLDDYWIRTIILYAKPEKLVEYLDSYSIDLIKHQRDESSHLDISQGILRLLQDHKKLTEQLKEKIEGDAYLFRNNYRLIFSNIIILLPVLEIKENIQSQITHEIIDNLIGLDLIFKPDIKYFARYLYKNRKRLSEDSLRTFLYKCIQQKEFHEQEIFHSIQSISEKENMHIKIDDDIIYGDIIANLFFECPKCKTFHHTEILVHVYDLLSDRLKKDMHDKLVLMLNEKFDKHIYYVFSLYGIIDYKLFFDKYLAFCKRPEKLETIRHPFDIGEIRLHELNKLLNLAFKFKLDLSENLFQQYKGILPYYDWLIGMGDFDYRNFQPDWALEYQTSYYLEYIFTNKTFRSFLREYLKEHKHPLLSEYYIEYSDN
jgi:hypothetical protein